MWWDTRDFLQLPRRRDGRARFLDAREFAIVWLLGGGWPQGIGVPATAGEVITLEKKNMFIPLVRGGVRANRIQFATRIILSSVARDTVVRVTLTSP